jgi:hypothetical protein
MWGREGDEGGRSIGWRPSGPATWDRGRQWRFPSLYCTSSQRGSQMVPTSESRKFNFPWFLPHFLSHLPFLPMPISFLFFLTASVSNIVRVTREFSSDQVNRKFHCLVLNGIHKHKQTCEYLCCFGTIEPWICLYWRTLSSPIPTRASSKPPCFGWKLQPSPSVSQALPLCPSRP